MIRLSLITDSESGGSREKRRNWTAAGSSILSVYGLNTSTYVFASISVSTRACHEVRPRESWVRLPGKENFLSPCF